jgi:hypothetical protein
MIQETKCPECSLAFQVLWDDNIDALNDEYEYEDAYSDILSKMESQDIADTDDEILFCPFCGAEVK